MTKYNIDIMLTDGEVVEFTQTEAENEEKAINEVADTKDDFVTFKKDTTFYKINEDQIIGYKVTSASDTDDPVKQTLN
jgi:ribosomal protein L5